MSALSIQIPFPVFQGRDGQPLKNGYIWIGEPNLNPQTNPVVAYYDAALTIVAPQPLRTLNGYVSRAGTPAQIYVDAVNFSILVQDSKGSMVYNFPEGTGISPNASGVSFIGFKGQVGNVQDLADDDGSDWIGFDQAGAGAVATTVQAKLRESVSVKDFGAVGNGITDDTAAVQAFFNALSTTDFDGGYIPEGDFLVTSTITWTGAQFKTIICDGQIRGNFALPVLAFSTANYVTFINLKIRNESTAVGSRAIETDAVYSCTYLGGRFRGGEYAMRFKRGNLNVFNGVTFHQALNGIMYGAAGDITGNLFTGCGFEDNTTYGFAIGLLSGVGKVTIENSYFESNLVAHVDVGIANHNLDVIRNTFQISENNQTALLLENVGSGLAQAVRFYDNMIYLNGAYTVYGVKQANSLTMRLVRVRGNKFAGIAGTTDMYGQAPYVVVEEAEATNNYLGVDNPDFAYDTAGVPDSWVNGGGTAAAVSATSISPYTCPGGKGKGRALTKPQQYVYQQIVLRPNTLYRFSCWAAQSGAIEARMQVWNTGISSEIGSTGSGTKATTSATGEKLDWYWASAANTACRVLLRLSADTATASFSDLRVQDLTNV